MTVTSTNLDGYGAPVIEWQRVQAQLGSDLPQIPGSGGPDRHTPWLTTITADGAPHVRPVGISQVGGVWYFTSGPGTHKSRNLAVDPTCVVSVATHQFDLVVEGRADRVNDNVELRTVADKFNCEGWPVRVQGDALTAEFSAPSAGPPPWSLYRVTPARVYAFGTAEPFGATMFDFAEQQ